MEAAAQGLRDKLEDEVEKERLSQLREREVLKKLHQKEVGPLSVMEIKHLPFLPYTRTCAV